MRTANAFAIALALTTVLAPAARGEDLDLRGWGIRLGIADDPDQFVGGVHFDLGEIVDRLRFVPNAELGVGDDQTILALTAPVHWRWEELKETKVVPYVGGGLTAALINFDDDFDNHHDDDDNDFELAFRAIGGAEWPLKGNNAFFVELNVVAGDVHDIQAMAGWTFR